MDSEFAFDVFLSHNSKDKPRVTQLAERLKTAGLRVWFDKWVIRPGDDVYLAIERGLEASRTLILCMSAAAVGSDWVTLERSTALFRDPTNRHRRFIPLLLADCKVPETLRRYKYLDYRKHTGAAFEELIKACRGRTDAPQPTAQAEHQEGTEPPKRRPVKPFAVLERKLQAHLGRVYGVAISPDGQWIASGSSDHSVGIWNPQTGNCIGRLQGHSDEVNRVAITPDGRRIVSASDDRTIRVWDVRDQREICILKGHTGSVISVATLADGRHILSGGTDNTIRLWNIETERSEHLYRGRFDGEVWAIAATTDGARAVSGGTDRQIRYWDLRTKECLLVLSGHSAQVNSVQITPDGRYAVTGSDDHTVKIWDLEEGVCTGTLEGHAGDIYSVTISPDGAVLASTGSRDQTLRLWDRETGSCLQIFTSHDYFAPFSAAFSPDGQRLVVGADDGEVYVFLLRLTSKKRGLGSEVTRRYINAKVVLVGESGVGKSALAHRLIEDKFVPTHSTHGMKVWRLDLPLEKKRAVEREALLWDLAGQQDYRLIHQLFLDETALALVLINPQNDDPFEGVGDWLKALKAAAGAKNLRREAKRLLIAARVDVGAIKVSQRKIDRALQEGGFAAYLSTSAKRGDNCSDSQSGGASALKQLITRHIPWDTLPWTSTPRLLADIKIAMLDMASQRDNYLLRFAELRQRLEQTLVAHGFEESDVRTAITLLANHGLVTPLKFGDLVLFRPELLNGYAGAVIRAARAHTDEIGCVREDDIYSNQFDFEGVERLERSDEELLLRAMVQIFLDRSLCIAEDTQEGRHLIFPSQYRRERPIPSHPEVFVSYTFAGELQTVYTTLVVRLWYSREFDRKELWRNAAEFLTSKGRTVGLIMERVGEGVGEISVFFETGVPDELKVVFIEFVHRHLETCAHEVRRDRRYVCPHCAKPVTDLEAVRERLAAGKTFVYCQKCDKKVLLIDHIEQRLATDPVARRVLGMDARATEELNAETLEPILTGHTMSVCREANQIFRTVSLSDYGIDGEVEFRDNNGQPSGRKIYVQLKSSASYVRTRRSDGKEIFYVKAKDHLDYWMRQAVDVYLVNRDDDETIRWMNITAYLTEQKDKGLPQIVFAGVRLDARAVWQVRDDYIARPRLNTRLR